MECAEGCTLKNRSHIVILEPRLPSENIMSDHVDVQDTIATRFLGIALGLIVIGLLIVVKDSFGWHHGAVGAIGGVLGATFGAAGTSVQGPINAAVLGWAGALVFAGSVLLFAGILPV